MAFRFGTSGLAGRTRFRGGLSRIGRGARRGQFPQLTMFFTVDRQKSFFFDRFEWQGILNDGERVALRFIGGWIRKTARRSMRTRRRVSRPGEPPSVWSGELKRLLFFFYMPGGISSEENAVIVGPAYLPSAHRNISHLSQNTIPRTLELGGTETRKDLTQQVSLGFVNKTARIAARPYMNPALMKAISRGVIRQGFTDFIALSGVRTRRVA